MGMVVVPDYIVSMCMSLLKAIELDRQKSDESVEDAKSAPLQRTEVHGGTKCVADGLAPGP